MTLTLKDLNNMPADQARGLLAECCGSSSWVNAMLARRPFKSAGDVYSAADQVTEEMTEADWMEAFAHHPRIGETKAAATQSDRAQSWSAAEQSGVSSSESQVRRALADANAEYEREFGYIYIVCAAGKSAAELLEIARKRLKNSPEKELRVAAEEQKKITRLRLEQLLGAK